MGVGDLRLFKRVAGKQRFNALQEKQYRAIKTRARVAGSVLALFGCLAFAGNEWDSGSIFSADGGNHIARRSTQNDTDPPFVSNYTCKSGHVTPVTEPQYSYGIGDCDCFEKRYKELFNYTNVTWTAGNWSAQSCDVKSIPEGMDPCVFVTCTADCQLQPDSGYINYLRLPYCQLKGKQNGASVVILVIWLLVLFVALGTTAEDFFCPSLSVISDTLGLSDNVAGVTFLALGNGAPDIFSVYAGIVNTKGTKGGSLAIGELFGAGVFVTTVVFGAVSFVAPFTVTRRPFLRDCVCYMTATIFLFYVMLKGEITIEESAGFLVIYVVYVLVVVFGRKIYQAKKKQLETDAQKRAAMHTPNDALGNDAADDRALLARISPVSDEYGGENHEMKSIVVSHVHTPHHHQSSVSNAIKHAARGSYGQSDLEALAKRANIYEGDDGLLDPLPEDEGVLHTHQRAAVYEDEDDVRKDSDDVSEGTPASSIGEKAPVGDEVRRCDRSFFGQLAYEFYPFDDNFAEQKWYWKVYGVVRAPIYMLLVLTVPIVDFEEDNNRWCRPLNSMHCFFGLLGFAFASQLGMVAVGGNFFVWELMLVIGAVLGPIIYFTTVDHKAPRWQPALAYIGFAVAIMWISAFANEIVNILETVGRLIGASDAILGLTVLAWGNSIGDLVADVTVARQGFPRMGVGAAIGGPAMNMLLGIGIACTIKCGKLGHAYPLAAPHSLIVSGSFLMASLLGSMTIVPFNKFAVGKKYCGRCSEQFIDELSTCVALLVFARLSAWPCLHFVR
eukprot:m.945765 g.945765  ORF g.945765 m.945765 type:complete len:784 (+) comp23845_c0_seq34:233-2584(+)